MEAWRAKALELLPELAAEIEDAEEPMELWIEISLRFNAAYVEPRNVDLIRRIYEYAFWGLEHGARHENAGKDLPTSVALAFYEHIPAHPAARADMPRWFTREEVLLMRELFSCQIGEAEYDRLLELFPVERSNHAALREARKQNRQKRPWAHAGEPTR